MYYGCSTQPNSRATVSFPCMYVRTYIYTKGEPQRHRLAHVQGLNACATSTVGRTPTSMLRRPPGVGVDCAHATPTIQKETLETPFHPDTHPGRSRRRCACTVRGGGACEHTRTSGITCAALAGMLHGRALTGTGTSVVPGIATRSLSPRPLGAAPCACKADEQVVGFTAEEMDGSSGARRQRRGVLDSKTARGRGRARARPTIVHRPPREPLLNSFRGTGQL